MRVLLSGLSVCEHNYTSDQGHIFTQGGGLTLKDGLDLDMDRKVVTVLHLLSKGSCIVRHCFFPTVLYQTRSLTTLLTNQNRVLPKWVG